MPTIVSTGQLTITDMADGLNARLSSESHILPASSDGVITSYSGCATTMSVFLGSTDDTAQWSFQAVATGLTGGLAGSTYTVTGMVGDAGFADITASRSGFSNITARFSVTKARNGAAGPSGPTISLVSSGQGFTFQDGVAEPVQQIVAITVVRQGIDEAVIFAASNGKTIKTDNGQLAILGYMTGAPGVGRGDTAYLDLTDFGDERQVTITAFCGTMSASLTLMRLDFSTAAPGATRNVYRGAWAADQVYQIGDAVIDGGYGWSCTLNHTSAAGNKPPVYPVASNASWALSAVKGDDGATGASGISAILSNEAHGFPASFDGVVSSYAGSGTEVRVYEGATELAYDGGGTANGTWKVATVVANIIRGALTDSGAYLTVGDHSGVASGTDLSSITYTITGKALAGAAFTIVKKQSFVKSKAGTIGVDGAPGANGSDGAQGPQGVQGPTGPSGASLYTWLKYADSPTTGMSDSPTGKLYIGLAHNKTTATESSAYADYSWSLVKGADGVQGPVGPSGAPTYTWIKYGTSVAGAGLSDSPDGMTYIGLAYNKAAATESAVAADYTWSLIKGSDGAPGQAVMMVSDRPATFTSTDGVLDGAQANITLTANTQGLTSPTYAWTFSGLETNPTASTTASQTITAAQFGTSKAAIVIVTVNGAIVDKMTIVRLEKSTAEAGATVGAEFGGLQVNVVSTLLNESFSTGAPITNLAPSRMFAGSTIPENWAAYNNGGISATYAVLTDTGLFQANKVRVTANANTTQSLGIYTASATGGGVYGGWVGGSTYLIRFKARANTASAVGFQMYGLYSNMGFTSPSELLNPALTTAWQDYAFVGTAIAGAAALTGELFISWKASGTFPAGASYDLAEITVQKTSTIPSASVWQYVSGVGESVLVSDQDAESGSYLQIGNNSGNDQGWLVGSTNVAYNPAKLYRIKVRAKSSDNNPNALFYAGVAGVAANGITGVSSAGVNEIGSQHYVACQSFKLSGVWKEYAGYFTGSAAAGGQYSPDAEFPALLKSGIAFVRPVIIGNYASQAGVTDIDYVKIEEVSTVVIPANVSGQITAGNASTFIANAAITAAQIADATITTAKIGDAQITAAKIGSIALVGTTNFSVKTATAGARMEMDSRAIKVIDASGIVRVQIGDLTV